VAQALLTPGVNLALRPYAWEVLNDAASAGAATGMLTAPPLPSVSSAAVEPPIEVPATGMGSGPARLKGPPEEMDAQ
jgi:hypothetical protein